MSSPSTFGQCLEVARRHGCKGKLDVWPRWILAVASHVMLSPHPACRDFTYHPFKDGRARVPFPCNFITVVSYLLSSRLTQLYVGLYLALNHRLGATWLVL